jgi:GxxExxY protein
MAVHRATGPGYREDTYQRDLATAFLRRHLSFEEQKLISIYDSAQQEVLVGYYIPDFVVEGQVVVEIKALSGLDNAHVAHVVGYLVATGCPVGLLINFGARSLQHRRILPPTTVLDQPANNQWLFIPDWLKKQRGEPLADNEPVEQPPG